MYESKLPCSNCMKESWKSPLRIATWFLVTHKSGGGQLKSVIPRMCQQTSKRRRTKWVNSQYSSLVHTTTSGPIWAVYLPSMKEIRVARRRRRLRVWQQYSKQVKWLPFTPNSCSKERNMPYLFCICGDFFFKYLCRSLKCSELSPYDAQGAVYKQLGISLIGTGCKVFVIHCNCLKSQIMHNRENSSVSKFGV